MSDIPTNPEVNHEANDEVKYEVKDEKDEVPVDVKRVAKLEQLASARICAKNKKRQREEEMTQMKSQLDSLLASTKTEPVETEKTEPKKQQITKEPEEEEQSVPPPTKTEDQDHWSTSVIRTTAVLSLGAASWWMQNRYKKPTSAVAPPILQKKSQKAPAPVLSHQVKTGNSLIGRSGFVS